MSCKDFKSADKDIRAAIAKDLRRRKFKVRKGKMTFLLLTSSLKYPVVHGEQIKSEGDTKCNLDRVILIRKIGHIACT